MMKAVRVVNLGRQPFLDVMRVQEITRRRIIEDKDECSFSGKLNFWRNNIPLNTLLLVEHWPVYTAGLRDGALTEKDEARLRRLGAEVHRTNRGGLATFHGPGQMVAYPIIDLRMHNLGLRRYVELLERVLIDTCKDLGVEAHANRETGVWVEDRKVASIGVNAKRHVTIHGVALNCSNNLSWFDHITACGLNGVSMTSITKEVGKFTSVSRAQHAFLVSFADHFNCDLVNDSSMVPAVTTVQLPSVKNPAVNCETMHVSYNV